MVATEVRLVDSQKLVGNCDKRAVNENGEEPWYEDGIGPEPNDRAVELLDELYRHGHTIIVWTARAWRVADEAAAWLTANGVRYHGLRMSKGSTGVYLDDKTVDAVDL